MEFNQINKCKRSYQMLEGLGSYTQYLEENNIEHSPEQVSKYFAALHLSRVALAEKLGMTPEELHRMPIQYGPTDPNQQTVAA
jgi:hypothetical protein